MFFITIICTIWDINLYIKDTIIDDDIYKQLFKDSLNKYFMFTGIQTSRVSNWRKLVIN